MQYGNLPRGLIVPMISPFNDDHTIDLKAVDKIVNYLVSAEVEGIFLLGTTGEGRMMSPQQKGVLVDHVARRVGGKTHLYVGLSDNELSVSVQAGHRYSDLGADYLVAHPPTGGSITADGISKYFTCLADKLPLPLVIYNIPKIAGVAIEVETVSRLADHPNIVGLKDSEGDESKLARLLEEVGPRHKFTILVGSAALSSFGLRLGADGLVPSTANLIPGVYRIMIEAARCGDWNTVDKLQQTTNIVSLRYQKGRKLPESIVELKRMMNKKGLCGPVVVLPTKYKVGGTS